MGGRVLEYEAKTIFNEGKSEGRREGRMESNMETAKRMNDMGMSSSLIAKALAVTEDMVKQWLSAASA